MEHDHMVKALPPNGRMEAITLSTLARCQGARGADSTSFYAHVSHLISEVRAEDGVPVAQQVARRLVEGKGLPQLLSGPLRGRVRGHVAVKNAPPVMGQDQKHVKNLETEGRHGEEIDGDRLRAVIAQKGARSVTAACGRAPFADAALGDVDT